MTRSKRHAARITWFLAGMVAMLVAGALPSAWSQTATTSIKFLSPTSFAGEMPTVTDDDNNGLNDSYRLSAWVAGAPAGSLVEFELVPGDSLTRPITIGAGEPVAGDTYEYHWDIAEGPTGVLEGEHTLKATLYSSSSEELSVDKVTVDIIHGPTAQAADEGETPLDMTYPVSGGPLGQYTAPNGKTNSVFDSVKVGSAAVEAWFTTSSPGTAPVWKLCNAGESDTNFPDGVRCTYTVDDPATKDTNEAVDPAKVTAVGLVQDDGSGDVVRVIPYAQEPTGFRSEVFGQGATGAIDTAKPGTLTRQKDPHTGLFGCSDWVRVKATDQVGRAIAGVNLDAHAQGPSDQLKFHTSYLSATQSASLQPPSEAHSFPEPGTRCVRTHDEIVQQGEHGMGGLPDRKHVETTSGTRDNGTFDFALESDQPGTTQLTVWLERKDDDKFCSDEPSVAVALGWGSDQITPSGEQPADCAGVPVDPTDQEPFDGSRSAAIEPTATAVKAGRNTTVVGSIEAADDLCEAGQTLQLKAKKASARRFKTVSTMTTDAFGLAGFKVRVDTTKLYRVVAPAAGECALARSTIRKIRAS